MTMKRLLCGSTGGHHLASSSPISRNETLTLPSGRAVGGAAASTISLSSIWTVAHQRRRSHGSEAKEIQMAPLCIQTGLDFQPATVLAYNHVVQPVKPNLVRERLTRLGHTRAEGPPCAEPTVVRLTNKREGQPKDGSSHCWLRSKWARHPAPCLPSNLFTPKRRGELTRSGWTTCSISRRRLCGHCM
jgi:hypothetical protein